MKFRNLPTIIVLVSGFFACIITLIYQYPIDQALWIIVVVMVIFYLIGLALRKILNMTFEEHSISNEKFDESDSDSDSDGNSNLKI